MDKEDRKGGEKKTTKKERKERKNVRKEGGRGARKQVKLFYQFFHQKKSEPENIASQINQN